VGFHNTPYVTGRRVNMRTEILPHASLAVAKQIIRNSSQCWPSSILCAVLVMNMYSILKPDFKGNVARFRKGPPTPRRVGRIGSGVRFSAMFQKIPCLIWVGNGQDPASCGSDKVRIPV